MKVRFLRGLAVVAVAGLLAVGLGLWWSTRDTTLYADDFSEGAFGKIKPGMHIEDVHELLGEPLLSRQEDAPERWCYGEIPMMRRGSSFVVDNVFQPPRCVFFDDAGVVIRVTGNEMETIQQGMNARAVRELVGEPSRRTPAAALTLHYSQPGGEGLFRGRIVVLDRDRRVSDVISYQFYD